jgi:hypothetical protein
MKKLTAILSVLLLFIGSTFAFAQDKGNDMDKGKHKGMYKHHVNRGLHRGQVKHPVKMRSPRATTAPKAKKSY